MDKAGHLGTPSFRKYENHQCYKRCCISDLCTTKEEISVTQIKDRVDSHIVRRIPLTRKRSQ